MYPTSGRVGHQPMDVPMMVRMYLMQHWYDLADDELYCSRALRNFVGIDLLRGSRCRWSHTVEALAPAGDQQPDRDAVRRDQRLGKRLHNAMRSAV